jgi:hypothetical protein
MTRSKKHLQPSLPKIAGFVCWWRMPTQPEESRKQKLLSIAESIETSAQAQLETVEPGQWKNVRIAAPGRYFWGFVRR